LLQGKVNVTDYANTTMTNKIGNKSYNIQFLIGSAEISESSKSVLDQIYTDAVTADGTKLLIGGHTDNTGNPQSNLDLSSQRAQSVLNYIKQKGLGASRLKSEGYGQNNPIGDNNTTDGRSKNRRVEITLLGK
jgi:outer membrane protein OmpA-like peptidoglycan-associated protein